MATVTFEDYFVADQDFALQTLDAFEKAKDSVINMYGSSTNFKVEQIRFCENAMSTWFPAGTQNTIVIRLNQAAYLNKGQMYYQLGHEIVHWLSPVLGLPATILEEGLAERHAKHFTIQYIGNPWFTVGTNYAAARELIDKFEGSYNIEKIKEIRKSQSIISKITADDILQVCPDLDKQLAEKLTEKFI